MNEHTHTQRVSSSFFVRDRSQFSTEQNTHSCIAWHFWVNLLIKLTFFFDTLKLTLPQISELIPNQIKLSVKTKKI
jgi:hypothetical protein